MHSGNAESERVLCTSAACPPIPSGFSMQGGRAEGAGAGAAASGAAKTARCGRGEGGGGVKLVRAVAFGEPACLRPCD